MRIERRARLIADNEDEHQLVGLLVRPGDDCARRRVRAAVACETGAAMSCLAGREQPVVVEFAARSARTIGPSRRKWVSRTGALGCARAITFSSPMLRPPTKAVSPSTTRHFLVQPEIEKRHLPGQRRNAGTGPTGTPCPRKPVIGGGAQESAAEPVDQDAGPDPSAIRPRQRVDELARRLRRRGRYRCRAGPGFSRPRSRPAFRG